MGKKMPKNAKIGTKVRRKNRKTGKNVTMERVPAYGKNKNLKWKIRKND